MSLTTQEQDKRNEGLRTATSVLGAISIANDVGVKASSRADGDWNHQKAALEQGAVALQGKSEELATKRSGLPGLRLELKMAPDNPAPGRRLPSEARTGLGVSHTALFPFTVEAIDCSFEDLLVAYDFSVAADTSLKYAVMLARHFRSSIRLISVLGPDDYARGLEGGLRAMEISERDLRSDLCAIQRRLRIEGIDCDAVRLAGNVSDVVGNIILEHRPGLLLLGAYGYNPSERSQLGSTAEHILHMAHCPVLTIGPHALLHESEAPPIQRVLCATSSLQPSDDIIFFAARFATRIGASLELIHSIHPAHSALPLHHHEQRCMRWSQRLREHEIPASWTLAYERPEGAISDRATAAKSSLIIFGLHRLGDELMDWPDGVVSATIHQARCPVMTIPLGLPL